jgi:ABC-2 type transport system permease protein
VSVAAALQAYWLLLWWQFLRMRQVVALLVVIQLALALGIVYGLALLLPDIDSQSALYLTTGAPTVTLLLLGLTVVPQEVGRDKVAGRVAYLSSLPVPRLAAPAADVTFWLLAQLPGTALAVVVGALRFHFELRVNGAVAPAIALVALTGAAIGHAFAMSLKPELAQQLTSFLSIGILLFSPINFPAERLPDWLEAVHRVLPLQYMADLVRWSLTGQLADGVGLAFAVVAAWCAAAVAISWRVAVHRS